jgi:flagellar biosynthesis/type III secretory pathway M-ring protein FliF/YscJ
MSAQWWVVLVVAIIIVAIVATLRSRAHKDRMAQERRMNVQAQGGAHSIAEDISTREDRRLAGMTAEDRDWEQASLQRNRDTEAHARRTTEPEEHR